MSHWPAIPNDTKAEVIKRFTELENFLKNLEGYDYMLDIALKDKEGGYDVFSDEGSSNWNASWC